MTRLEIRNDGNTKYTFKLCLFLLAVDFYGIADYHAGNLAVIGQTWLLIEGIGEYPHRWRQNDLNSLYPGKQRYMPYTKKSQRLHMTGDDA